MSLQHYGWLVSPYSAKTRCYLRYKKVDFVDRHPTLRELYGPIRKAVGRMIMPTVRRDDGSWLQDTSDIIDAVDLAHPTPSVFPPGPTQQLASALLELHGDEWLPMVALHYRWNYADNSRFAMAEFARTGFPWAPQFLARRAVSPVAKRMRRYLPALGVDRGTIPGVERIAAQLICRLDAHLSEHAFILGGRPCVGDFALFGPLWAHLYRDPASTALFDGAPHVRAWFQRILEPSGTNGEFLEADAVPESLDGIFATLFEEQIAWVNKLVAAIDRWCADHPSATRVPRALGMDSFSVGGAKGERKLITFVQYKAQRAILPYRALGERERETVDAWIARVAGPDAQLPPIAHPFERRNFRTFLK